MNHSGKQLAVLLVLGGLAVATSVKTHAQSSSDQLITFQARVTQAGVPVNGVMNLTFEIHATQTGGTALWSEQLANVRLNNGLLVVRLGGQTSLDGVFAANADRYVAVRDTASAMEIVVPRVQITAVPYALNAAGGGVPIGTIVDWFRPDPSVPTPDGWAICDGQAITSGPYGGFPTPDLRGKFTRGIDPALVTPTSFGITAGTPDVAGVATLTMPQHTHGYVVPYHTHQIVAENSFSHDTQPIVGLQTSYINHVDGNKTSLAPAYFGGGFGDHQHSVTIPSFRITFPGHSHGGATQGPLPGASVGTTTHYTATPPDTPEQTNLPPCVGMLKIMKVR